MYRGQAILLNFILPPAFVRFRWKDIIMQKIGKKEKKWLFKV